MKLALLTNGIYPYVTGGMQKHSFYLAKFFVQNGIEVELYHIQQNFEYEISNLEYFSKSERKLITSHVFEFPRSNISFPGHYVLESWQYSKLIFDDLYIKLDEIDFIYANSFTAWKLLLERKEGLQTPPIGINFHGYEMFQKFSSPIKKLRSFPLRYPVQENIKNTNYIFSLGGKITQIIKSLGCPKQKIIEIPNGIGLDWMKSYSTLNNGKIRKFIFVGRYERRKGIEELTQVLKGLEQKSYKLEIHFVGDIPSRIRLEGTQYIYHEKLLDSFQIQSILHQSDVLLCPSYSEGMPTVILEGMASGLAIIATDVGAVSNMVSSHNGWLIEPGDKSQLQQAIIEAINISDNELLDKKQYSQGLVEDKFTWDKIAKQTINSIEEIVASKA